MRKVECLEAEEEKLDKQNETLAQCNENLQKQSSDLHKQVQEIELHNNELLLRVQELTEQIEGAEKRFLPFFAIRKMLFLELFDIELEKYGLHEKLKKSSRTCIFLFCYWRIYGTI